ncbi:MULTISPECIES: hypothetical protein [Croceibacter]|uniref:hypothetical protein n=1 Tax=Croceibacter TaxID=216431 RepID=UPI000C3515F1|nr:MULTISPECIES: hypothetical protein [Croceibacter]MBG26681.1 hypothetical protein [Croceibacter sp.]|tara:strand:+ start:1232 stop:1894 length:663 start_codon:yes stop_codon:yes gene_type:complete
MKNPWLNYDFNENAFHKEDVKEIEKFNNRAKPEFKLSEELLPDPYIGNINSKILLLALNPGLSEADFLTHSQLNFKELHRKNIDQTETEYPFYYLNPKLNSPGSKWWKMKLKWLIEKFGTKKVSESIFCLQFIPYHSIRFKKSAELISTQKFTKNILRNHIEKKFPIVIMRSKKYWIELVPELENYENSILLRNPRNPTLSPKNIGENNYKKLIELVEKS